MAVISDVEDAQYAHIFDELGHHPGYPDVNIKKNFEHLGLNYIQGVRLLVDEYLDAAENTGAKKVLDKLEKIYKYRIHTITKFDEGITLLLRELLPLLVKFVGSKEEFGLKGSSAVKAILGGANLFGVWMQDRQAVTTTMQYMRYNVANHPQYALRSTQTIYDNQILKNAQNIHRVDIQGNDIAGSEVEEKLAPIVKTIEQQDIPIVQLTDEQKREYLSIFSAEKPRWFSALKPYQQDLLCSKIREGMKALFPKLTDDEVRQYLVNQNKVFVGHLDAVLHTIPSSLRSLPGLANFGEHALLVKDNNDQLTLSSVRYRWAVPVPIDIKSEAEKIRLAEQNIIQFVQAKFAQSCYKVLNQYPNVQLVKAPIELPIMVQALLQSGSDIFQTMQQAVGRVKDRVQQGEFDVNVEGITFRPQLLFANYPINVWRVLGRLWKWVYDSNDADSVALIQSVNQFLGRFVVTKLEPNLAASISGSLPSLQPLQSLENMNTSQWQDYCDTLKNVSAYLMQSRRLTQMQKQKLHLLLEAASDYVALWHKAKVAGNRGRNLFFAGLGQIMADAMSCLTVSSCKSGKDREGLKILHTDAMLIYYDFYGELPKYDDVLEKRDQFSDILSDLFLSQHAQVIGDLNMPGAEGLQNIGGKWKIVPGNMPDDVAVKIEQKNKVVMEMGGKFSQLNKPTKYFGGQLSENEVVKLSNSDLIKEQYDMLHSELSPGQIVGDEMANDVLLDKDDGKLYSNPSCTDVFSAKQLLKGEKKLLYNYEQQVISVFYDGAYYYRSIMTQDNKTLPTQYSRKGNLWLPLSRLPERLVEDFARTLKHCENLSAFPDVKAFSRRYAQRQRRKSVQSGTTLLKPKMKVEKRRRSVGGGPVEKIIPEKLRTEV